MLRWSVCVVACSYMALSYWPACPLILILSHADAILKTDCTW